MKNFVYSIPTKIFFGKGQIEKIGTEILKYGKKVLLVYGKGSIKSNGIYDKVIEILKENEIEYFELGGIDPNPRTESVYKGAEICKENKVDLILAMGGGSTIDCAKAISLQSKYDGDFWEDLYINGRKDLIKEVTPVASILTLSATGSEMNGNSVISKKESNLKVGFSHEKIKPVFSVEDPEYTYSVNKYQTCAGAIDIMSHLFEQYFSTEKDGFLQNRLIEGILKTVIHYAPIAIENPKDYEARANIMWASSLGLNELVSYGKLSTDWATHNIEHQLSAVYDITHGIGLGILTPAWMKYVLSENNIHRFVDYGKNIWNLSGTDMEIAEKSIEKTKEFFTSLGCPSSLSEINIDDTHFEKMAENAVARGAFGSMKKLNKEDVIAIYKLAL
ncbi:iron-containing alcohol dehydrogenase [Fusobacterium sp.]|uniref:iron-containing alcohol dehydrogenase n=1 Tax=Fusobacterium sp. TaxID=68766 RepID=UPI00261B7538|nr:iron-containing alcohol dehydrogenase [Fusobacterium sp.]